MKFKFAATVLGLWALSWQSAFGQAEEIRRYNATPATDIAFAIKQTKTPIFPSRLKLAGYTSGHASFSVFVNQYGELQDMLLLEASHMEFASSVEKVLPEWDYSVPFIDGEKAAVVSNVKVTFDRNGAVVYEAIGMYMLNQLTRSIGESLAYRIHLPKELDSIPEPIYIVKPEFHVELLEERDVIKAVFEFYIDQEGNIRMPTLKEADDKIDERLLVIAQEALLQWKFNPPTINGRPVVTKTGLPFRFRRSTAVPVD